MPSLARRIVVAATAVFVAATAVFVAATAVVVAAPAAANAAPIVRHTSEGPSATPLIVELIAAVVAGLIFVTRKPIARLGRATFVRVAGRRDQKRLAKPARVNGG